MLRALNGNVLEKENLLSNQELRSFPMHTLHAYGIEFHHKYNNQFQIIKILKIKTFKTNIHKVSQLPLGGTWMQVSLLL